MKKWFWFAVSLLCLIGVIGCTTLDSYLDIVRDKGLSQDYMASMQKWTRSQIVYSQFETQVHISATCRGAEFNRAYLKEYALIYNLSAEERRRQAAIEEATPSAFREFIFYAMTPEKSSNDFDRRGSIWSIFLMDDDGERIDPVEVSRIEPITPLMTEFFPYINPHYGNAYRLRFPFRQEKVTPKGSMKLVFTGVLGRVELEYDGF